MKPKRKKTTHANRSMRGTRAERLLRAAFQNTDGAMTFDQIASKLGDMDNFTGSLIEDAAKLGGEGKWWLRHNKEDDSLELADEQHRLIGKFPSGNSINFSAALACIFARETWHETRLNVIKEIVRSSKSGVAIDKETCSAIAVPSRGGFEVVLEGEHFVEVKPRRLRSARFCISIPVDEATKAQVSGAADAAGVPVAEWCRIAIGRALGDVL